MKTIYVISRIDFDDMENRFSDAVSKKLVGFAEDHADAQGAVLRLKLSSGPGYKGRDGEFYPKFEITKVDEVKP